MRPEIFKAASFEDFKKDFAVGAGDLVITDRIFENINFGCDVIYEDDYGRGEPTDEKIDKMLELVSSKNRKRIIAVGGGTAIDISKLLVDSSKKTCEDVYEKPIVKDRTLIAVPTTCGTGSEVTNISIVAFIKKQTKIGRVDEALYPDQAVLIPELLSNLPYGVFITSSVDALIHSIESFLSPKATEFSKMFSVRAMKTILSGYLKVTPGKTPDDLGEYLTASLYAGIAFSNAGCGLVHAMSYPIGGTYHLPHGAANAKVFMNVMDYYNENGDLSELFSIIGEVIGKDDVFNRLKTLINHLLVPKLLSEMGMNSDTSKEFAASVIATQQRLLANAYIDTDEKNIENIYNKMLEEEKA